MHRVRFFLIASLIGFACPSFADQSLAIITHKANTLTTISLDMIKRVYLRKSLLDKHAQRWIPVNLPITHELRRRFSLVVFNKQPEDQEDYWNEQYFHGINPPEVFTSEEAVLRFVAITPGAIGYVSKQKVDNRVKLLALISLVEQH